MSRDGLVTASYRMSAKRKFGEVSVVAQQQCRVDKDMIKVQSLVEALAGKLAALEAQVNSQAKMLADSKTVEESRTWLEDYKFDGTLFDSVQNTKVCSPFYYRLQCDLTSHS